MAAAVMAASAALSNGEEYRLVEVHCPTFGTLLGRGLICPHYPIEETPISTLGLNFLFKQTREQFKHLPVIMEFHCCDMKAAIGLMVERSSRIKNQALLFVFDNGEHAFFAMGFNDNLIIIDSIVDFSYAELGNIFIFPYSMQTDWHNCRTYALSFLSGFIKAAVELVEIVGIDVNTLQPEAFSLFLLMAVKEFWRFMLGTANFNYDYSINSRSDKFVAIWENFFKSEEFLEYLERSGLPKTLKDSFFHGRLKILPKSLFKLSLLDHCGSIQKRLEMFSRELYFKSERFGEIDELICLIKLRCELKEVNRKIDFFIDIFKTYLVMEECDLHKELASMVDDIEKDPIAKEIFERIGVNLTELNTREALLKANDALDVELEKVGVNIGEYMDRIIKLLPIGRIRRKHLSRLFAQTAPSTNAVVAGNLLN